MRALQLAIGSRLRATYIYKLFQLLCILFRMHSVMLAVCTVSPHLAVDLDTPLLLLFSKLLHL